VFSKNEDIIEKIVFFTPRPKPQVGGAVFYLITESRSHFTRANNYYILTSGSTQEPKGEHAKC
jgi:hypothetical protein